MLVPRCTAPSRREVLRAVCGCVPVGLVARRLRASSPTPGAIALQSRSILVPLVDDTGVVSSSYAASNLHYLEDLGGGVSLDMTLVPGGSFAMGTSDPPFNNDPSTAPVHNVSVPALYLGTYLITRGQWRQVSTFPQVSQALHAIFPLDMPLDVENTLPIDAVFAQEAQEFCARLANYTGRPYRLPSEAEWEYCCRAGTTTTYHFGDGISLDVANYNALQRPLSLTPVGSKNAPNRFGLNDMHGNALEWCADLAHPDYNGAPTDGSAWMGDGSYGDGLAYQIARGGMYLWAPETARSAERTSNWDGVSFSGQGFRVAFGPAPNYLDPQLPASGVVSAASLAPSGISPGRLVALFGLNIGPEEPASQALDQQGMVASQLAGVQVLFDGIPAPLLFVSANQVNAVVPYGAASQAMSQVIVNNQGQTSAPATVPASPASPAIFTLTGSGVGQGAILNQDASVNSIRNPALPGSIVSVYATGAGQTNPPGVDGQVTASSLPVPVLPVQVTIASLAAEVSYAGAAPGFVAGVLQVNVQIPPGAPSGSQPVVLSVGSASSPLGVTVAIK